MRTWFALLCAAALFCAVVGQEAVCKVNDGGVFDAVSPCEKCNENGKCERCEGRLFAIDGKCEECDESCKTCAGEATLCEECNDGYYVVVGSVQRDAEDKETMHCSQCSGGCKTCEGSEDHCTSCADGYDPGETNDDGTFACDVACQDTNCAACDPNNAAICTKCKEGFYDPDPSEGGLECGECPDGKCECQDGEYFNEDDRTCRKCSAKCGKCSGSADNCLTCGTDYYDSTLGGERDEPHVPVCESCDNDNYGKCKECDANGCTVCKEDYYSKDGKKCEDEISDSACLNGVCVCNSGMYYDSTVRMCKQCSVKFVNCAQCSDEKCTACDQDHYDADYKDETVCEAECSDNECTCEKGYFDVDSRKCIHCGDYCDECTNDGCTKCADGYYDPTPSENGPLNCVSCDGGCKCEDDEFLDDNNSCRACDAECATCSGSKDHCESCADGYFDKNKLPAPQVARSGDPDCTSCSADDAYGQCEKCNAEEDKCTLCKEGYYSKDGKKCEDAISESTCTDNVCECNEGLYYDATVRMCKPCSSQLHCKTCEDGNSCTACASGYYDDGSHEGITCEDAVDAENCPEDVCKCSGTNMYFDPDTRICKSCSDAFDNCDECTKDGCTKCDDGYYDPNPSETGPLSCVECPNDECKCKTGEFLDKDRSCRKCSGECGTCEESATKCMSCHTGYYDNNAVIVTREGEHVYDCQQCGQYCAACNSATECTSCETNGWKIYKGTCVESCESTDDRKYVSSNTCYESCPDGTHPGEGENAFVCYTNEPCDISCSSCDPVTGNCQGCATAGYKMYGTVCVDKCPNDKPLVDQGACVAECPNDRPYNNDGSCVPQCEGPTYGTTENDVLVCKQCGTNCASCDSDKKCNACVVSQTALYINGGVCVDSCPDGTYTDTQNKVCEPCGENCDLCNSDKCTSCRALKQEEKDEEKNLYINGKVCVFNCPEGKLIDEGECVANCPEAKPYNNGGTCVAACEGATYTDEENKVCERCGKECGACTSAGCTSCRALTPEEVAAGKTLSKDGKDCVFNCPSERALIYNGECVADCTGKYVYESKCYDNDCPTGTHHEVDEYTCKENPKCPDTCNCAAGGYTCVSCDNDHYSVESECTQCAADYGGATCSMTCDRACTACDDNSDCTACSGNYDPNAKCASCKSGYGGASCSAKCNSACSACDDTSDCTACTGNYDPKAKCASCKNGYGGATCSVTCNPACTACDDTSECTACSDSLLDPEENCGACIGGYYNSNTEGGVKCTVCDAKCATCSGGADKCTTCGAGYYNSNTEGGVTCTACDAKCVTCSGGADKCESCAAGYYNSNTEGGVTCTACDDKCATCSGGADKCETCAAGFFNSAEDDDGVACEACGDGCSKCTSASECSECKNADHFINNGACVESCPAGTYHEEGQKICKPGGGGGGGGGAEPARHSSNPVASPSSDEGLGAGAIVGIVVGSVALAALVGAGIYCFVTAGAKRGKIDPVIYEEDPEFISMSVL